MTFTNNKFNQFAATSFVKNIKEVQAQRATKFGYAAENLALTMVKQTSAKVAGIGIVANASQALKAAAETLKFGAALRGITEEAYAVATEETRRVLGEIFNKDNTAPTITKYKAIKRTKTSFVNASGVIVEQAELNVTDREAILKTLEHFDFKSATDKTIIELLADVDLVFDIDMQRHIDAFKKAYEVSVIASPSKAYKVASINKGSVKVQLLFTDEMKAEYKEKMTEQFLTIASDNAETAGSRVSLFYRDELDYDKKGKAIFTDLKQQFKKYSLTEIYNALIDLDETAREATFIKSEVIEAAAVVSENPEFTSYVQSTLTQFDAIERAQRDETKYELQLVDSDTDEAMEVRARVSKKYKPLTEFMKAAVRLKATQLGVDAAKLALITRQVGDLRYGEDNKSNTMSSAFSALFAEEQLLYAEMIHTESTDLEGYKASFVTEDELFIAPNVEELPYQNGDVVTFNEKGFNPYFVNFLPEGEYVFEIQESIELDEDGEQKFRIVAKRNIQDKAQEIIERSIETAPEGILFLQGDSSYFKEDSMYTQDEEGNITKHATENVAKLLATFKAGKELYTTNMDNKNRQTIPAIWDVNADENKAALVLPVSTYSSNVSNDEQRNGVFNGTTEPASMKKIRLVQAVFSKNKGYANVGIVIQVVGDAEDNIIDIIAESDENKAMIKDRFKSSKKETKEADEISADDEELFATDDEDEVSDDSNDDLFGDDATDDDNEEEETVEAVETLEDRKAALLAELDDEDEDDDDLFGF